MSWAYVPVGKRRDTRSVKGANAVVKLSNLMN